MIFSLWLLLVNYWGDVYALIIEQRCKFELWHTVWAQKTLPNSTASSNKPTRPTSRSPVSTPNPISTYSGSYPHSDFCIPTPLRLSMTPSSTSPKSTTLRTSKNGSKQSKASVARDSHRRHSITGHKLPSTWRLIKTHSIAKGPTAATFNPSPTRKSKFPLRPVSATKLVSMTALIKTFHRQTQKQGRDILWQRQTPLLSHRKITIFPLSHIIRSAESTLIATIKRKMWTQLT